MFDGVRNFFGRREKEMYDSGMVKNVLKRDIAISPEMAQLQNVWREMYEDSTGLHLATAISFEMARMVTLELNSKITGSRRAEFLDEAYQKVIDNIRIPVEHGCAKGGLVMKPYVANGEIWVDFIQADGFFPTAFDESGRITGAIFIQPIVRDGKFYTRVEEHKLVGDRYEISNRVFKSYSRGSIGREVPITSVKEWANLAESCVIGNVKKPLFGYFKPAIANTVEPNSPVGVSVFANAVNLIRDADKQYERFLWEFESGERALIANTMAFKRDKDGRPRLPDKRLYKTLDVEDVDFFREWSPQIREEEFSSGFDKIFRQIEFNCGFAYGTISAFNDTDKTAEEIRTSRQRSYTTITDNQKALRNALNDLVYAMDVWCSLYKLAPAGKYSVEFDFDDSIAADRKTEFEEKQRMVESGIMMPWEFRMWYFGEDEETAKRCVGKTLSGI